jgi:hypothetical protein
MIGTPGQLACGLLVNGKFVEARSAFERLSQGSSRYLDFANYGFSLLACREYSLAREMFSRARAMRIRKEGAAKSDAYLEDIAVADMLQRHFDSAIAGLKLTLEAGSVRNSGYSSTWGDRAAFLLLSHLVENVPDEIKVLASQHLARASTDVMLDLRDSDEYSMLADCYSGKLSEDECLEATLRVKTVKAALRSAGGNSYSRERAMVVVFYLAIIREVRGDRVTANSYFDLCAKEVWPLPFSLEWHLLRNF